MPDTIRRQKLTINIPLDIAAWLSWQATVDSKRRDTLLAEILQREWDRRSADSIIAMRTIKDAEQ